MGVVLSASTVQMCLSAKGYREALITEAYAVACWPLHEAVTMVAHDITGNMHDGTFTGASGFTRGVPNEVPEGGLGCTFDGNGYVTVPDDTISAGLGTSLAGGSMDIAFLLKTSHSSGTLRAIIQKQLTNSAGNGYHVALQSGAIVFRLRVGGVDIFNFSRGSVADNAWHLVHCYYDPVTQIAAIYIDGAQSGSTVGTTATDPAYQAVALRIGMFTDGAASDGSGFIGSLSLVMIGREGNTSLAASLQAARTWTTVTDVRQDMPIEFQAGIPGTRPTDLMARTGTLTLGLDNSARNSQSLEGAYSPGHANIRTGFRLGTPVRWHVTYSGTTYYLFVGRISKIEPETGNNRRRLVRVQCVDWLDVAASTVVRSVPALVNTASHTVISRLLDEVDGRTPHSVSLGTGSETFPYSLDIGAESPLISELGRVLESERGHLFIASDTTRGGALTFAGRQSRQQKITLDATLTNTMRELDVSYDMTGLINRVFLTVYPRQVDSSPSVLFQMPSRIFLSPREVVTVRGEYRDPLDPNRAIGGVDMITPVSGTDYTARSNADGSGGTFDANFDVTPKFSGRTVTLRVYNESDSVAAWFSSQVRGTAVRHEDPIEVIEEDLPSIRLHGPKTLSLEMPYVTNVETARSIARYLINGWGSSLGKLQSVAFDANTSSDLMLAAVTLTINAKVGIEEAISGLTTDDPLSDSLVGYHINGIRLSYGPGQLLRCTWSLASSPVTSGVWILDQTTASVLDETTIVGV